MASRRRSVRIFLSTLVGYFLYNIDHCIAVYNYIWRFYIHIDIAALVFATDTDFSTMKKRGIIHRHFLEIEIRFSSLCAIAR